MQRQENQSIKALAIEELEGQPAQLPEAFPQKVQRAGCGPELKPLPGNSRGLCSVSEIFLKVYSIRLKLLNFYVVFGVDVLPACKSTSPVPFALEAGSWCQIPWDWSYW